MRLQALSRELLGLCKVATSVRLGRSVAWIGVVAVALWSVPTNAAPVYTEPFNGPGVPSNWVAQNGSAGLATLIIVDETGGINTGNALSISSATRQGVIGEFSEIAFADVGDKIELCFDVRLTAYPNNSGGLRFGLYHDNDGLADSSGYRALLGTGSSFLSTDVQADGGDTDIGFGTNRENPAGFQSNDPGIDDNDPHSMRLILTRTTDGVSIDVWQDGVSNFPAPVEHISGMGAGTPVPLQLSFNQIMFTTNAGTGALAALVDNVQVKYTAIPEPASFVLAALGTSLLAFVCRSRGRRK